MKHKLFCHIQSGLFFGTFWPSNNISNLAHLVISYEAHDFSADAHIDGGVGVSQPVHDQVVHPGLQAIALALQITNKGYKALEGLFTLSWMGRLLKIGENAMHKEISRVIGLSDPANAPFFK